MIDTYTYTTPSGRKLIVEGLDTDNEVEVTVEDDDGRMTVYLPQAEAANLWQDLGRMLGLT